MRKKKLENMLQQATIKLSQHDKDIKKFGFPRFKGGDKVITSLTGHDILTIQGGDNGGAWSNGHTWMYYFEENEMGIGQEYITGIVPVPEGETHPQTKMGQIKGEIVAYQQLIAQLKTIKEPLRTNIIVRAIGECHTQIAILKDYLETEFMERV